MCRLHGPGAVAAGMAPDLRAAFVVTSADQFTRILRSGARAARGMPAYADITDQELTALQHYIRQQAELLCGKSPEVGHLAASAGDIRTG